MRYYLKKCGFQELGSVGEDGKAKRGRYLLTPMNSDVLQIFPTLSRNVLNDCAVLPVIPLYTGKKTYCNFVYHNDKFNGSTARHKRNEYRIYLNTEMEGHQYYLESEDILILRSENVPDDEQENGEQTVYFLDVLKDHSSGDYVSMSRIIEAYPINGGYGLFDGTLDFFEDKVDRLKDTQYSSDIVIDKTVTDRIEHSSTETKENLFNPATFRDFVLSGYGNACAVTGKKADNIIGVGVDVVYIKPRSAGGSCLPSNGIALEKDLSLPFVQGKFTLSENFEVIVHPQNDDEQLLKYHLRQIRVPPKSFFQPDSESMKYHREKIYGSFL